MEGLEHLEVCAEQRERWEKEDIGYWDYYLKDLMGYKLCYKSNITLQINLTHHTIHVLMCMDKLCQPKNQAAAYIFLLKCQ